MCKQISAQAITNKCNQITKCKFSWKVWSILIKKYVKQKLVTMRFNKIKEINLSLQEFQITPFLKSVSSIQ